MSLHALVWALWALGCEAPPPSDVPGPGPQDTSVPSPPPTSPPPPVPADCDLDGLDDAREPGCAAGGPERGARDSDGGGEVDGVEVGRGSDPCNADDDVPGEDADGDGWSDPLEALLGTDPAAADADGDLALDPVERAGVDANGCTGDETDPGVPDTDGDGIDDGEDAWPTDPTAPLSPPDTVPVCVPAGRDVQDEEFEPGGARVSWQWVGASGTEELVVGRVDAGGAFVEPTVVDTDLEPVLTSTTGPEWLWVEDHAELVYAKRTGGPVPTLWHAWPDAAAPSGWSTGPLAGAPGGVGPYGTTDGDAWIRWSVLDPAELRYSWVRRFDDPTSDYVYGVGLGAHRFARDTNAIVLVDDDPETGARQVFVHVPTVPPPDPVVLTRLTSSPGDKEGAFSWRDPTLGQLVFTTLHSGDGQPYAVQVVRMDDGSVVTTIPAPPSLPYVVSPEPFVWAGASYVSYEVSRGDVTPAMAEVGHLLGSRDGPSELWIARVDEGRSGLVRRISARNEGLKAPEPYLGLGAPTVYYARDDDDDVWRCETGL